MDYGMIRKYEKAKQYAEETDRIEVQFMLVSFKGKNNPHTVELKGGQWHCDCSFFQTRGRCSHTMALELIFKDVLPQPSAT
jgi:hypothetical protein